LRKYIHGRSFGKLRLDVSPLRTCCCQYFARDRGF